MTIEIPEGANLSSMIELLIAAEAKTATAREVVKDLEEDEKVLHAAILTELQKVGVDRVAHAGYTAKREESIVGQIKDFDQFTKFVHRNKYYHLFERRIATLAYRELLGIRGVVPGVEPFTKVKLSFRKNAS